MNASSLHSAQSIADRVRHADGLAHRQRHEAFAQRLRDASASPSAHASTADARSGVEAERDAKLREAAEQLVASAFVQPMLNQLHESPFKTERFGGGSGEKLFRQRLDTILADRIAGSPGFPLVDTLVNHMQRRVGRPAPTTAPPAAPTTAPTSPNPAPPMEIDTRA